ncbi:lysophospholipase [Spiroplasma sabaudiense Ar-1343]|uniref:Lysophospholipase n=1 Tax=Spiroplasma sabaudiense Ar-1343 TaxID=1276257 RepID=W6A956_9MOLU|nr:alpha/beta fold hydrolase [Spiroplasma sabaudiense]AHI53547.1 lysophospholipase [Spiroplasma sabaudiense Ar-1343]
MKEFKLTMRDNKIIHMTTWDDVKKPVGVLQLVHGSCEEASRYDEFAKFLNKNGFIVVADDHRGHGHTANIEENELGWFADENGWEMIIDDLKEVNDYIKKTYPSLPVSIFGHSMGSFMVRHYLIKFGNTVNAAIICGTAEHSAISLKLGILLASKYQKKHGAKEVPEKIWKLSYKALNKRYSKDPNETGFEWMNDNPEEIEKFINNPRVGQKFSSSAFKDMFTGLLFIRKKSNYTKTPKNLPLFFIAGLDDPVGQYGKSVYKVRNKYKKSKYKTALKLYPKLRHEILLEKEEYRQIVSEDILKFLNSSL